MVSRAEAGPPEQDVPRAAVWMLGSIAAFSLMAVGGRTLSAELDTFEIMAYRSAIGIVVVSGFVLATGRAREVRARRMGLHLARNAAHFAGQNLWFYAITAISLAQVFAIEFTSPLWVALAAPLVLGERADQGARRGRARGLRGHPDRGAALGRRARPRPGGGGARGAELRRDRADDQAPHPHRDAGLDPLLAHRDAGGDGVRRDARGRVDGGSLGGARPLGWGWWG